MFTGQNATLRGATNDAQVQLVRNGDLAVTAAQLADSYLNEALAKKGFPPELAEILGTAEIMLARAIESQGTVTATAIDLVRAETMMAIYKSEMRMRGKTDNDIADAAVAAGIGLNLSPIWPVAAAQASVASNVSHSLSLVIAPANRHGGSGVELRPYMAINVNALGQAVPSEADNFNTIGLAATVDGTTCTVALPGDLLTTDTSAWEIGETYFPNITPVTIPLVKWADVPALYLEMKACARAVKADQLLVLDGQVMPHMQVLNGLV